MVKQAWKCWCVNMMVEPRKGPGSENLEIMSATMVLSRSSWVPATGVSTWRGLSQVTEFRSLDGPLFVTVLFFFNILFT